MARSFWLTLVCAVCLVVFMVKIEASPAAVDAAKNSTKNSTKASDAGGSDEACDLDPEPEAEAEPTGNKQNNSTKSGSDRQGKALDWKDTDKYNTTDHHGAAAEPEPESEPNKNGTAPASLNNKGSKSDDPTAGKSTGSNTTTTTAAPTAGGSKSVLSFTALALLALPVLL